MVGSLVQNQSPYSFKCLKGKSCEVFAVDPFLWWGKQSPKYFKTDEDFTLFLDQALLSHNQKH